MNKKIIPIILFAGIALTFVILANYHVYYNDKHTYPNRHHAAGYIENLGKPIGEPDRMSAGNCWNYYDWVIDEINKNRIVPNQLKQLIECAEDGHYIGEFGDRFENKK